VPDDLRQVGAEFIHSLANRSSGLPGGRGYAAWFTLCSLGLSLLIIAVMVFYGYDYWHIAFERNWKSDTVWGVRLWIPYMALPIGFGLLFLQLFADLVAVLLGIHKPFGLEQK